jgi:hypothetical protein
MPGRHRLDPHLPPPCSTSKGRKSTSEKSGLFPCAEGIQSEHHKSPVDSQYFNFEVTSAIAKKPQDWREKSLLHQSSRETLYIANELSHLHRQTVLRDSSETLHVINPTHARRVTFSDTTNGSVNKRKGAGSRLIPRRQASKVDMDSTDCPFADGESMSKRVYNAIDRLPSQFSLQVSGT